MLPLRFPGRWRGASLLLLCAVLVLALLPAFWIWDDPTIYRLWLFEADKWLHGLTFAFLTVWFCGQYDRRDYWRIAVGLLAFGILIELCQRQVGYRSADWHDVAADAAGIVLGLLIGLLGAGGWSMYIENRLAGEAAPD